MDAYELRVLGAHDPATIALMRWELFVFPEVRDVVPTAQANTVAVVVEDGNPDPAAWCAALRDAGYPAEPVGMTDRSDTAA